MKKSQRAREDPYKGLLNISNTPTEATNSSPAQRIFGRRTLGDIPMAKSLLLPSGEHMKDRPALEKKKAKVAERHVDRRVLKPLSVGDHVSMQPIVYGKSDWQQAQVTKAVGPRTYEVKTPTGKSFVRNRQFLRKHGVRQDQEAEPKDGQSGCHADHHEDAPVEDAPVVAPVTPVSPPKTTETRSGRTIRKPKKLNL